MNDSDKDSKMKTIIQHCANKTGVSYEEMEDIFESVAEESEKEIINGTSIRKPIGLMHAST